ncbi:MAG TPA: hypothetical protein VIL88_15625 [Devosia sp.]|uniref:tetratricopeptide repeat protein n=1 Tax=Devosia sp. TaxID=1871048 RepID=UPI002F93571C
MRLWSTIAAVSVFALAVPVDAGASPPLCRTADHACLKGQLEHAATAGDIVAKIELARMLLNEPESGSNWGRAAGLLHQAARTGDAWSVSILASLYREGKGVPEDGRQVMKLLIPLAAKGSIGAVAGLGDLFASGATPIAPDPQRAARYFARAAAEGDVHSKYQLALMLLDGNGVRADIARAITLLEELNRSGDPWISIQLGEVYASGKSGPAERAIDYFAQAAETGNASAMVRLAQMYQTGIGTVGPDLQIAMDLLEQAAALGDMGGQVQLALVLLASGTSEDASQAIELLERAAETNQAWPATILAQLYAEGRQAPLDGARAVGLLQPFADQGVTVALTGLGGIYAKGAGIVPADPALARHYFEQAAGSGDLSAKNRLGFMLINGEGGTADVARGLRLLEPVMESGDTWAMLQLGDTYAQGTALPQNAERALHYYGRAAELGNAAGLSRIGMIYRNGLADVAPDLAQAQEYFERALAEEDATGRIQLALLLLEDGPAQDIARAEQLLAAAASEGDAWATTILADLLTRGEKVEADGARALALLQPLAEQGNAAALSGLGVLYARGAGTLEPDPAKAGAYFEQAAALNDYVAKSRLGMMLIAGEGVAVDPARGLALLREVAAIGDGWAKIQLGDVLSSGKNVPLDPQGALAAYQAARDAGLPAAAIKLGYLFLYGKGNIAPDPARAANHFADAAEADLSAGKVSLALLLLDGKGVEKNVDQAVDLLQEAAGHSDAWASGVLGGLYADGRNLKPDYRQARDFSQAAFNAGDQAAMLRFGMSLAIGPLAPDHRAEGIDYVTEAVAANIPGAVVELARLQSMGLMGSDGAVEAERNLLAEIEAGNPAALRLLLQVYRSGGPGLKASPRKARGLLEQHAALLTSPALAFETVALHSMAPATEASLSEIGAALSGIASADFPQAVQMMFWGNKNAYVYALQFGLRDVGLYSGPMSGYLTKQTISAINQACAQQQIEEICRRGPLTPEVAVSLGEYLATRPAPLRS